MYLSSFQSIFVNTLGLISNVNNIAQFVTFTIAFLAILYFILMNFTAPIQKLISPIGISRSLMLRVLFVCRKNPRNYIRVFCEYAILKSDGKFHKKSWWKKTYYDFVAFFKDTKSDEFIYCIDNCTDVLSDDISTAIDNYFEYFSRSKVKKKYKLSRTNPISFLTDIEFRQGFLSANFLLSGLLANYKDNWSNLIKKYISTSCKLDKDDDMTAELYFTFAWLLWGPSYQMKHQDFHYKLCQYAFGDENNSIIVVLNDDNKFSELWTEINKNVNGLLSSLTCKLYRAENYINHHRDNFDPRNSYFINKVIDECTGYLLEPVRYEIMKDYKAQNYYSTAYVWIMFEAVTENESHFHPENTLTFFEHANLADRNNYDFCIEALISKSFLHFDQVFGKEDSHKKYRLCMAMNQYIEEKFLAKLGERRKHHKLSEKYRDNFSEQKLFSERVIFSGIDSYFLYAGNQNKIVEVALDNKDTVRYLGEYYTGVYISAFPDVNERETLDNILECLKNKSEGLYGKNNYHVLLTVKQHEVVAGLICDYMADENSGVIEFIATKNELQSEGLGTHIYNKAIEILKLDAINNHHDDIDYIFCEVEKPNRHNKNATDKALSFWSKMGYRKLDINYIQPALDLNKSSADNLNLIAVQINKELKDVKEMNTETLKNVIKDYARIAMRMKEPGENTDIIRMLDEMNQKSSIGFINLFH